MQSGNTKTNYIFWESNINNSNFRQVDRIYDGDLYLDPTEDDHLASAAAGIDNSSSVIQNHHQKRSRDNMYEYRDVASAGKLPSKSPLDSTSMRGPSSMGGLTLTTRSGSQQSVRSGISLKELPISPSKDSFDKGALKYSERSVDTNPKGRYEDTRSMASSKSKETIGTPSDPAAPVPSVRNNLKSSRTHLIQGIPQTEV